MTSSVTVRTVTGDRRAAEIGTTNYHEHLFQVSPLLPGDELTDERASLAEASALQTSGFQAMVDATPIGLGRAPAALARISRTLGLTIIATTGAHRLAHYADDHWLLRADHQELVRCFTDDVVRGMPRTDHPDSPRTTIRAGLLKAGLDYWQISPFAQRVLRAIAVVHAETNAPVMIHLEHGSAGHEVLDLLADNGVPAEAVALAHIDRNPDPGLHAELAARGAYLGYDGPARHREWPDSMIIDCLIAAADQGAGDRLLLGGDVARATRYRAHGGIPGLAYLGDRFLPRLRAAAGEPLVTAVLEHNPARWLGRFSEGTRSEDDHEQ